MSLVFHDPTPTPIPLPSALQHFTDRDLIWLWDYLHMEVSFSAANEFSLSVAFKKMHMAAQFTINPTLKDSIPRILQAHTYQVVGKEVIQWIDRQDDRLLIWIIASGFMGMTFYGGGLGVSSSPIPTEYRYEQIIRKLDWYNTDIGQKTDLLLAKKQEWVRVKTPESDINWLKANDSVQIQWAWRYLGKMARQIIMPIPVTDTEIYNGVLASIDVMSYGHPSDKTLFIDKMKKTWSQKKFRDSGKAKKLYHLPLTDQAKKSLDELAKLNDMKPAAFLEELIKEAYAKDILDEKGKRRYKSNNPI